MPRAVELGRGQILGGAAVVQHDAVGDAQVVGDQGDGEAVVPAQLDEQPVAVPAVLGPMAVLTPLFTSLDPIATDTSATSLPPGSPGHRLGTDLLGRGL